MLFKDNIGQQALQKELVKMATNNRIHHTQLLLGKSGGGSLAFARAYAQFLLCENRAEFDSCGQCNACEKVSTLIHPDVHYTFPTVTTSTLKKPISKDYFKSFKQFILEEPLGGLTDWLNFIDTTKRPNITARECLEIIKNAKYKPREGRFSINIIWMAEYLAKEGNRLLKILEEPPSYSIFILVAEQEENILNTILSRAQIHRLSALSDQSIFQYLQDHSAINEAKAKEIASLADGDLKKAIQLSEHNENSTESELTKWLQVILKDKTELVNVVTSLSSMSNQELKNLLFQGTQLCREALILRESELQGRLPEQEQKIAIWLGKKLNLQQIHQIASLFEQAIRAVDRHANAKVSLMSTSLDIGAIIKQRETV